MAFIFAMAVLVAIPSFTVAAVPLGGHTGATRSVVPLAHPYFPTPIQHVIVIVFENRNYSTIMNGPGGAFEQHLARTYGLAANDYSFRAFSEPAYLAMTSGLYRDVYLLGGYNVTNIGDLTRNVGLTWGGYMDGMNRSCLGMNSFPHGYEKTHDPFVQYTDIQHHKPYCYSHVVNMAGWNSAVATGTVPNYALIVPSLFNDSHSGSISVGDNWLKNLMSPIMDATWFSSTVVFITYDEGADEKGAPGPNGTTGGHVYTAVVSPYARIGYVSNTFYTTLSILTTTEWLLGLGNTGNNDNWTQYPPMRDLFSFPVGLYAVSGTLTDSSGTALTIAHVSVIGNGVNQTVSVNSTGSYQFSLTNGWYNITATAPGFLPQTRAIDVAGSSLPGENFQLARTPPATYRIGGTVFDQLHQPIPGALVNASGGTVHVSTVTNGTGGFALALPNGTYSLTAQAVGYQPQSMTVTVSGASIGNLQFTLQVGSGPTYLVTGRVLDAGRSPISRATVTISGPTGYLAMVANSTGEYSFRVGNGTYVLTANATGFLSASKMVPVLGAALSGIDFVLTRAPSMTFPVSGTILGASGGGPIFGATVYANGSVATESVFSGAVGTFILSLPNGTYTLSALAPGFVRQSESIFVNGHPLQGISLTLPMLGSTPPGGGSSSPGILQWILHLGLLGWAAITGAVAAIALAVLYLRSGLRDRRSGVGSSPGPDPRRP
jgi:acid phosphatase